MSIISVISTAPQITPLSTQFMIDRGGILKLDIYMCWLVPLRPTAVPLNSVVVGANWKAHSVMLSIFWGKKYDTRKYNILFSHFHGNLFCELRSWNHFSNTGLGGRWNVRAVPCGDVLREQERVLYRAGRPQTGLKTVLLPKTRAKSGGQMFYSSHCLSLFRARSFPPWKVCLVWCGISPKPRSLADPGGNPAMPPSLGTRKGHHVFWPPESSQKDFFESEFGSIQKK